jgi:hypothetical protein
MVIGIIVNSPQRPGVFQEAINKKVFEAAANRTKVKN